MVSVQTGLKRESDTNEIKHELAQTAAVDLLPNESHLTANVSLLARWQKLFAATLRRHKQIFQKFKPFLCVEVAKSKGLYSPVRYA